MLYDRCYLTKRNNEWIGLVELRQRIGERWRFAAWLAFIIAGVEAFRLALAGFWYFNKIEFVILILSTVFAIAFFRRSSKPTNIAKPSSKYRSQSQFTTKSGKSSDTVKSSISQRTTRSNPTM